MRFVSPRPFILFLMCVAAATVASAGDAPRARLATVRHGINPPVTERDVQTRLMRVASQLGDVPGVLLGHQFFPQSVASGDPHPDSVVVWTRLDDKDVGQSDVPVLLIVTKDRFFQHVVYNNWVMSLAKYDHCIKVKIPGLDPRTSYLYFFAYFKNGVIYLSQLGRTKTAPAPGDDVSVKFAFFSCQDYEGRYYNTYAKLLLDHPDDLDFVAFLGDYIYETTGDPSFQTPVPGRTVDFTDKSGAIQLGDPAHPYYAASSLSNYRQLYSTYRSDPMLQRLHERYPMVAIWDDHEYSNDNHGATATYFDKRKDETDPARRRRAEQVFFEYMPISAGLGSDGTLKIDDPILYPNAKIYQDLRFGANLDLVLTDYRSFRPDVVIPEDGFPGTIVMDRAVLETVLTPAGYGAVKGSLDPYVKIENVPPLQAGATAIATQLYMMSNPFLTQAQAVARAQSVIAGNLSATYLNALFVAVGQPAPFGDAALATMDRGLSYLFCGKRDLYSSTGSRYVIAKDSFDLFSGFKFAMTGGASEDAYGAAQESFIRGTIDNSTATWKVFTSSVSMTPMILDFTNPIIAPMLPPDFPAAFKTRLMIDADEWDGFPHKRQQLLAFLQSVPNSVVISGDIHGSFVADHGKGVFEFTGAAVSSQTLEEEVLGLAMSDPMLSGVPGIDQLVKAVGQIMQISASDPKVSSSQIVYDNPRAHGCVLIEAGKEALTATYLQVDASKVAASYYDQPDALNAMFSTTSFKVQGGTLTKTP